MVLNDAGNVAKQYLLDIPKHFPHVLLTDYVVMPNHVHFIIEITKKDTNADVGAKNFSPDIGFTIDERIPITAKNFSNENILTNNDPYENRTKIFSPLPMRDVDSSAKMKFSESFRSPSKTVGSVVRGFKIGVTKWFRVNAVDNGSIDKLWQRNYYEHIIRTPESHDRITNYIHDNPARWKEDKFYKR
jgi:REP element-mobilizing transposase RayT